MIEEEKRKLVKKILTVILLCLIVVTVCAISLIGETLYGNVGGIVLIAWFDFWIMLAAIAYSIILINSYYKEYRNTIEDIEALNKQEDETMKQLEETHKQLKESDEKKINKEEAIKAISKKKRGRPKKKAVGDVDEIER